MSGMAMLVRDQVTVLQVLISAAERVLVLRSAGEAEWLKQLCDDVAYWSRKPAPDGRVIHVYTEMMATALWSASRAADLHQAHDHPVYFRVVGLLLPDIRADFAAALAMRARPTP